MELKKRITLLDNLLALNEQTAGLPENQITTLVEFLTNLPEAERETVLDYIGQEDSDSRLARFAGLANMEPGQRDKILKAMGLQIAGSKGFLKDFLGATEESKNQVKQTIDDLAAMRKTAQEGFFEPLAQLFSWGSKGKK